MKTNKTNPRKHSPQQLAESLVYPSPLSQKQKEDALEGLRAYRKEAEKKRSDKDRLISQILQLKFKMEDYLKTDRFDKAYHFGFFLKEYIQSLEIKNKDFAREIDMDPTELSQIINKHRSPNDRLIIRLDIHSNKNLPALMWLRLIEKERAYDLIYNRKRRDEERKHVKNNLEFSI